MKASSFLLQCCCIIHSTRAFSTTLASNHFSLRPNVPTSALIMTMKHIPPAFNNIIDGANWIDLHIPASELRPNYTLIMGQCFNWRRIDDIDSDGAVSSCWIGILNAHPLAIRQLGNTTLFANLLDKSAVKGVTSAATLKVEGSSSNSDEALGRLLRDYFQTDYCLENLYQSWGQGCPRMQVVTGTLKGVRVVRQDPFECLISFICSSNNNIKRIALMLDRLRSRYGRYVCTVRSTNQQSSSDSKIIDSPRGNTWQVSIEQDLGDSMRRDLMNGVLLSPKSESITVKDEDEMGTQETPKVSRKRASEFNTPIVEAAMVHHIFEFPSIEALALATESELRALGMGYRAKFISGSALFLASKVEGGGAWLQGLRDMSATEEAIADVVVQAKVKDEKKGRIAAVKVECTGESKIMIAAQIQSARRKTVHEMRGSNRLYVQSQLMLMPGVGRKVADCVALFSLDQVEAIPVDTHVWDIALRDYDPSLSLKGAKSITPVVYEEVGEVFRNRFPVKAGWAHSVLFAAELPEFRQQLPLYLQTEMKAFAELTKSAKRVESTIKLEKRREREEEVEREEVTPVPLKRARTAATAAATPSIPTTPDVTPAKKNSKPAKVER